MKNILILSPDSITKSMGGLGVQLDQTINFFNKLYPTDFYFWIYCIGSGEDLLGPNYKLIHCNYLGLRTISENNFLDLFLSMSDMVMIIMSTLFEKIDIIHAFDWTTIYVARLIKKKLNVPLIMTIALSIEKSSLNEVRNNIINKAIQLETTGIIESDILIFCSLYYANLFSPIFNHKKKIIHNGVDIDYISKIKPAVSLPGTHRYKILYVGRFAYTKNIQELVKIKINQDVDILFMGSDTGSDDLIYDMMLNFCKKNPLNAFYLGPKYHDEKFSIMKAADVIIMPSIHEPFGLVALETLACSHPILLSSFKDGLGEILDNTCAINCGITAETIELAIDKVIKLNVEDKLFLIYNGIKQCQKFTWTNTVNNLRDVYLII